MGKFLTRFLSLSGEVKPISRNISTKEEWREAWTADVIWLSVPRDAIDGLLKGKKLGKKQLIVDICSIKRNLSSVIKKTGASHLSLHPLHGPNIPLNGQRWAVVNGLRVSGRNQNAKRTLEFLKDQGIKLLSARSEDYHDFMLGLTLSVPELLTVVIEELNREYIKNCKEIKPTRSEMNKWSVPASNAMYGAYHHVINSTAYWLRKEILCNAHKDLLKSSRKAFLRLSKLTDQDIKKKFKEQERDIKTLSPEERIKIRLWIENWFSDATKSIFMEKDYSKTKPEITIQYQENTSEIFPESPVKLRVGIHGIKGCFTHESILRFCEEAKVDETKLDLKFLVTAENVLRELDESKIDRGVFAMANSGSGAYVTSMDPMGKYTYKVMAVYGMKIMQCLLSHPGEKIENINEVFGHPQAVSQCKRTLAEKYPYLKINHGKDDDDTALCAKRIAEGRLPRTTATLASQVAAKLYNLNILSYNMHHDPFNTTTFLIVKRR